MSGRLGMVFGRVSKIGDHEEFRRLAPSISVFLLHLTSRPSQKARTSKRWEQAAKTLKCRVRMSAPVGTPQAITTTRSNSWQISDGRILSMLPELRRMTIYITLVSPDSHSSHSMEVKIDSGYIFWWRYRRQSIRRRSDASQLAQTAKGVIVLRWCDVLLSKLLPRYRQSAVAITYPSQLPSDIPLDEAVAMASWHKMGILQLTVMQLQVIER